MHRHCTKLIQTIKKIHTQSDSCPTANVYDMDLSDNLHKAAFQTVRYATNRSDNHYNPHQAFTIRFIKDTTCRSTNLSLSPKP